MLLHSGFLPDGDIFTVAFAVVHGHDARVSVRLLIELRRTPLMRDCRPRYRQSCPRTYRAGGGRPRPLARAEPCRDSRSLRHLVAVA